MPDVYLPNTTNLKIKRRSFRIEIENPETGYGTKSISYHQEDALHRIAIDAEGVETESRISANTVSSIVVPIEQAAMTVYEIADPVTGETNKISGYAIAVWLELDYVNRVNQLLNPVKEEVIPPSEEKLDTTLPLG